MNNRANPENCRALNRKYLATEKGKEAKTRAQKLYRERHKKKVTAHGQVNYAIKMGRLNKLPCQFCGEAKSQAHHADYDRPLDVIWLCDIHHKQAHALVGAQP